MNRKQFDGVCRRLNAETHVAQFGGAPVSKVGGKIFAIYSDWGEAGPGKASFKCSDLVYDILKEQSGLIPTPYLARAKWIQAADPGLPTDDKLRDYISAAHAIVAQSCLKPSGASWVLTADLPTRIGAFLRSRKMRRPATPAEARKPGAGRPNGGPSP